MTDQVLFVAPGDLHPSPSNPRKHLGDLTDMVASIRQAGVLQPIVARRFESRLEIVFGHRRHAAAVEAQAKTVPVLLRELDDDQVLELQIIENSLREDVHPLDEADGFAELIRRGYTVGRIAEKVGRPPSFVAQRLKLGDLGDAPRKALDEGRVSLAVALLLARVPAKLQDDALDDIQQSSWGEPASAAKAREVVEASYMLRLGEAPWQLDDETLVPKAGPCTTCPKRTGVQTELFADASSPDLCTDPVCHRSKLDAVWQLRKKDKASPYAALLDGKEARSALSYSGGYQRLDQPTYTASGKRTTLRAQLGKALPPLALVQDPDTGLHVEVVKRADAERVIREKAKARRGASDSGEDPADDYAARQKREEQKLKRRRKAIRLAIAEAVEKAPALALGEVLELVVRAFAGRCWSEIQKDILERRGIDTKGGDAEKKIAELAEGLGDVGAVAGLGIELAMRTAAPWHSMAGPSGSDVWKAALALVGVDFAALEKRVLTEEREAKKAKEARKKAKARKAGTAPKTGGGVVHLTDSSGLSPSVTTCGARPGTSVGSGASSSVEHVTCKSCLRMAKTDEVEKPKTRARRSRKGAAAHA